jgi:hypothetical protein
VDGVQAEYARVPYANAGPVGQFAVTSAFPQGAGGGKVKCG